MEQDLDNLLEIVMNNQRQRPVYYNVRYVPGLDTMINFFDVVLEEEMMRQTLERSMATYNDELFKKYEGDVDIQTERIALSTEHVKDLQCFICLEEIKAETEVYNLPCSHWFHPECILDAVKRRHARCPLCRKPIPVSDK